MKDLLDILIEQSARNPRDTKRENEIVAALRRGEGPRQLAILKAMFEQNIAGAIQIAIRTVNKPAIAYPLFETYLKGANAHSIYFVVEFGLAKLGKRRVIKILREKRDARLIDIVKYHYPDLVRDE